MDERENRGRCGYSEKINMENLRQKNLQHIKEMLQMLSNEQIIFLKGFILKYYFD